MRLDAEVGGALDDLLGHGETHVRIFRDAGLVVRDGDDGDVVLGDQRQDRLELLFLAGDRVDEGTALGGLEAHLEGGGDGTVDAQRHVADRLDDFQRLAHQRRLGFVGVHRGDAGIDVEDVGARRDLRQRVLDHGLEVAGLHLGGELLAARRVDAFTDDGEGLVETDDVLTRGGRDEGVGHWALPPLAMRVLSLSWVKSASISALALSTSASRSSPTGTGSARRQSAR